MSKPRSASSDINRREGGGGCGETSVAGLGVSLVPRSTARMRLPGVRFREVKLAEAAWDIGMAWRRESADLPLIQRFVGMVIAAKRPAVRRTRAAR